MAHIDKVLEYFEKDDDQFFPKKGYIVLCEGFTDDLVIYITLDENGDYYLTTPDGDIRYNPTANYSLTVYKAEPVVYETI